MEDADDLRNTSVVSQSYMKGINRITGNRNTFDDDFKICEEICESREKSWSWLFEKFSEVSDDLELNIRTLRPDSESSDSYVSEIRIPVRKSAAQVQYWINTGNPPCQAADALIDDTDDGTLSISESEAEYFEDALSALSAPPLSMIVNKKLDNSGERLIVTGSSASSVDTTAYILTNAKAGRNNDRDNRIPGLRNMDNKIIARCMNSDLPKVLLIRCTLPAEKAQASSGNDSVLCKSTDVNKEGERQSRIIASAEDLNIEDKKDEGLGKNSERTDELKDSEVTFESKESGIGSLAVEIRTEKGAELVTNEEKKSPGSSEGILTASNQTLSRRKRKLFTNGDAFFDLVSFTEERNLPKLNAARRSLHPALDSPSTNFLKKVKVGPRVLSLPGGCAWARKSRLYSINKRNKNKSLLSKSRALKDSLLSLESSKEKAVDSSENSISLGDKNSNHSGPINHADVAEKSKDVALAPETNSSGSKEASGSENPIDDSSSLSSKDVSQIINEELEENPKALLSVAQDKKPRTDSIIATVQRSDRQDCENDQGSIFEPSGDSSSETRESRMQKMLHIKRNLCATDLKSSGDDSSQNTAANSDADNVSNATSAKHGTNSNSVTNDVINSTENSHPVDPVVILHDFLDLRNCCGEVERENNEFWLQKQNTRNDENLKNVEQRVEKRGRRSDINENSKGNVNSKREISPLKGKQKLQRKPAASKRHRRNFLAKNLSFDTDDSYSSQEKTWYLRSRKLTADDKGRATTSSNYSEEMETDAASRSDENAKSRKRMNRKVPSAKKPKSKNELTSSKSNPKIRIEALLGSNSDESRSSKAKPPHPKSRTTRDKKDSVSPSDELSEELKPDAESPTKENLESKKEMDERNSARKKRLSGQKPASSKLIGRISLATNLGFETDDSQSSKEKTLSLRSRKSNVDDKERATTSSNHSEEMETDAASRSRENAKSKKRTSRKVPSEKKPKLENKPTVSKRSPRTSIYRNLAMDTDELFSSQENTSHLRSRKANDDEDRATKSDKHSEELPNAENVGSKKAKVHVRKKPKLENKPASFERDAKMSFITTLGFDTDESQSSVETRSYLRRRKANNMGSTVKSSSVASSTITFTNTNHKPIHLLSSSDEEEEDIFKKLMETSKRRVQKKANGDDASGVDPLNNGGRNTTKDNSGEAKSPKKINDYKIVSSSSEEDEKSSRKVSNVTGTRRIAKKYSKRNKRKDSSESTRPKEEEEEEEKEEDKCADRPEGFEMGNEELEKQSEEVNRRSAGTRKSKRSLGQIKDRLTPRSKVNGEILAVGKLRAEKFIGNIERSELLISSEAIISDKENDRDKISENLKTPVDRATDSGRKSARVKSRIEISAGGIKSVKNLGGMKSEEKIGNTLKRVNLRRSASRIEFTESDEEGEFSRIPNYNDKSKDYGLGSERKETCKPRTLMLVSDDESFDNDGEICFNAKNYAGDNSRDKRNRREDKEDSAAASPTMSSYKNPANVINRGEIKMKKGVSSSSNKNFNRRGTDNSKIVFQTKEDWESDS